MLFRSKLLLSLGLAAAALAPRFSFAAEQKLASVEVKLDDTLAKDASGLRTLFLIVYDNESKMRMPYGAMKVDLKADAKGVVYKGDLTTENVKSMMGGQGPLPKSMRVKARLDKDGSAGMDQAGDLVGQVEVVKLGEAIQIPLKTLVK